ATRCARAMHRRRRRPGVGDRRGRTRRRPRAHHVQRRLRWHSRQAAGPPAKRARRVIVYLHGFNSSPQSHKAQVLKRYMEARGLASDFVCPALPVSASAALSVIRRVAKGREPMCYVGSSLGGFYATYLVEREGGTAVLINPAIDPHIGLRAYLGPQKNLYTGEPYELTERHLDE